MSRRALPLLTAITLALSLLTSGIVASAQSAENVEAGPVVCCG